MANQAWSELSSLQLGRVAERYAIIEFMSRGYDVFTPEVDDHGVDFIAKSKASGKLYEIQVKAIRKCSYTFIRKDKMPLDGQRLICYLRFEDGEEPSIYIIPATCWRESGIDGALVARDYNLPDNKSKPEYGIRGAKKYLEELARFRADNFFSR